MFIYHYIPRKNLSYIKKYGLCSPKCLFENHLDIFKKTSFEIYKGRASEFLKKERDKITPEDIINFLDNAHKRIGKISSETLFFLFQPLKELNKEIQKEFTNKIEIKIKLDKIKYLTTSNPVLIKADKIIPTSFSYINSNKFKDIIDKEIKNKPGRYLFSNITHLALNIYKIPINKLIINS